MKKVIAGLMIALALTMTMAVSAADNEVKVIINSVEVQAPEGEVTAFISEHGQTVIGARTILDALKYLEIKGADAIEVGYDAQSHSSMWGKQRAAHELVGYSRLKNGNIRTFFDGQEGNLADTNTATTGLPGIPIMKDDRTYFPLRALLNWLGITDIVYDGETRVVHISIPESTVLATKPENVVAGDMVVAVVNGKYLTREMYMFYLNNDKADYVLGNNIEDAEDFWENGSIEGEDSSLYVKQRAFSEAVSDMVTKQNAIEAGITLSEANIREMEEYIKLQKAGGAAEYQEFLQENFLTEELLKQILETMMFGQEYLYNYMGAKEYFDTKAVCVKHILIQAVNDNYEPLTGTELAAKRKKAEQILAEARSGADFDALILSHGEDPGMVSNPDGYIFGPNGPMVEPFLKASLALRLGEVSGIVQSEYGFHIIKRYPLEESFYEEVKNDIIEELGYEKFEKFQDMLDEAAAAAVIVKTDEYGRIK